MRFLIAGAGSIGMRHLRNLRALGERHLSACDSQPRNLARALEECSAQPFDSFSDGLKSNPDVVFITTPSHLHIPLALEAANAGCHLFIEKPLSDQDAGIDELVEICRKKHLITMVACNMRFHHGPATIKRLLDTRTIGPLISAHFEAGFYMPDWHPTLDYRKRYSAQRAMGGGVILDAIHEIDYARWLLGEVTEVFCMGGKLSNLEIDVEDSADMLLKFESGFPAMVHVDYVQRVYSRSCKIVGEEGTILWRYGGQVQWFTASMQSWTAMDPPLNYGVNNMYLDELRYFLRCLREEKNTFCDVNEGARVTRLALAAKDSMSSGDKVLL